MDAYHSSSNLSDSEGERTRAAKLAAARKRLETFRTTSKSSLTDAPPVHVRRGRTASHHSTSTTASSSASRSSSPSASTSTSTAFSFPQSSSSTNPTSISTSSSASSSSSSGGAAAALPVSSSSKAQRPVPPPLLIHPRPTPHQGHALPAFSFPHSLLSGSGTLSPIASSPTSHSNSASPSPSRRALRPSKSQEQLSRNSGGRMMGLGIAAEAGSVGGGGGLVQVGLGGAAGDVDRKSRRGGKGRGGKDDGFGSGGAGRGRAEGRVVRLNSDEWDVNGESAVELETARPGQEFALPSMVTTSVGGTPTLSNLGSLPPLGPEKAAQGRHQRGHSRAHSRQLSFALSSATGTSLGPPGGSGSNASSNASSPALLGENTPPAYATPPAPQSFSTFSFGAPTSTSGAGSSNNAMQTYPANGGRHRGRGHSRQLSSISGLLAFSPRGSNNSSPALGTGERGFSFGDENAMPVIRSGSGFGGSGGGAGLRADTSSASGGSGSGSGSGSASGSGSEESPTTPLFPTESAAMDGRAKVAVTNPNGKPAKAKKAAKGAYGGKLSAPAPSSTLEPVSPGLEMPSLSPLSIPSFGSPSDESSSSGGFSFPSRHFEDGMRFGVATGSRSPSPSRGFPGLKVNTAIASPKVAGLNVPVPEVAIVPSTPMVEDLTGADYPFEFPTTTSTPPQNGAGTPPRALSAPASAMGEDAGSEGKAQERFGAFSFGKSSCGKLVAAKSEPELSTAAKKRHSHTRSTSISGYAIFGGADGGPRSRPTSPVIDPHGDESPTDGSASDELRKQALSALEGKREGMKLSVDWSSRESEMAAQRNSWGTGRRRQRNSLVEKVEIALPSFDDEEELSTTSGSVSPMTPEKEGRTIPLPGSPSRFSFEASPSTTRNNMFGKIVPLVETSSPFGMAGLGINGAAPVMASVPTSLVTLLEEEEESETESTPRALDSPLEASPMPLLSSPPCAPISPPIVASTKFRPLRLLSISTVASLESAGHGADDSRRSSLDRMGESSSDSISLSSPPTRAVDVMDSERPARRGSIGYKSQQWADPTKRDPRTPRTDPQSARAIWRRRMSGGSTSSNATFASSARAFHEVDSLDLEEPSTPSSAPAHKTTFGTPASMTKSRKRNSISHARVTSLDKEDSQSLTIEALLNRALQAEAENQAMKEDIEGWQDRVKTLEGKLDQEREHGRLLRERVRKLGDHLSSMSSMTVPPSSPPGRSSLDSDETSGGTSIAQLQAQLFNLAAAVETERREKAEALAETKALKDELQKEKLLRDARAEEVASRNSAPDVRPESVQGPSRSQRGNGFFSFGGALGFGSATGYGADTPEEGESPPLLDHIDEEDDTIHAMPAISVMASTPVVQDMPSPTPTPTFSTPDEETTSPATPAITRSAPPPSSIPILLNDDGNEIEIESAPPTPEPDTNVTRLKAFAFPRGPISRSNSRPKSIADPFFDLPSPDTGTPVDNTFTKFLHSKEGAQEGGEGLDSFAGLPPIEADLVPEDVMSKAYGPTSPVRDLALGFKAFEVVDVMDPHSGEVHLDFSKTCSSCSGAVFDL